MTDTLTPRKRSIEDGLPEFDDQADMVNAVISQLQAPTEKTNVAMNFANSKNSATEVQAYAKIAGGDWTFYVKLLAILIGRNTEVTNGGPQPTLVDIDLGPAKVVSRQHAAITYNLDLRCWELKVLGRNGAKIDGKKVPVTGSTADARATPLHSGAILDIGGTQMMFILPDSPPTLPKHLLNMYLENYKQLLAKRKSLGGFPQQHPLIHQQVPTIKLFQMFDKNQLQHQLLLLDTSLQNNLDQDLSKEESKDIKPPYSYATMITQAILSNPDGVMSLSEIYNWIGGHYAYYKYSKTGWQNLIRHNLSLNKAFEKVPRRPNEPGKGMKWRIAELYKDDFLSKVNNGQLLKQRRGLLVLRQLQLHLATHQQLPELQKYYQKDDALYRRTGSISGGSGGEQKFANNMGNSQQMPFVNQGNMGPINPMQQNTLAYINQQHHHHHHPQQSQNVQVHQQHQQQLPRQIGFQPQMMYGMGGPGQPPMGLMQNQNQQLNHHLQQPQTISGQPQSNMVNVNGEMKVELLLPIRQINDLSNTPKLPKVPHNLFNLPPPNGPGNQGSQISTAPQAHSRLNLYSASNLGDLLQASNSAVPPSISSTANTDLSLGFTSPKKITQLEAFTPERGLKAGAGKLGVPGTHTNQSSPAFWNFVQFSTPNGQTPLRKDMNDLNEPTSPTLDRKQQHPPQQQKLLSKVNGGQDKGRGFEKPDSSPLKAEDNLKGVKT